MKSRHDYFMDMLNDYQTKNPKTAKDIRDAIPHGTWDSFIGKILTKEIDDQILALSGRKRTFIILTDAKCYQEDLVVIYCDSDNRIKRIQANSRST